MFSSGDDGLHVIKGVKKKAEKKRKAEKKKKKKKKRRRVFAAVPNMVPGTQSSANMCQRNE